MIALGLFRCPKGDGNKKSYVYLRPENDVKINDKD
jgi:hypothetical protein